MRRVAGIAAALALAGCSGLQPYATLPATAEPGEPQDEQRVAICYDRLVSSLDEVQKAAQQECAEGTLATPVRTDWRLEHCPVLLPARATFACAPKK